MDGSPAAALSGSLGRAQSTSACIIRPSEAPSRVLTTLSPPSALPSLLRHLLLEANVVSLPNEPDEFFKKLVHTLWAHEPESPHRSEAQVFGGWDFRYMLHFDGRAFDANYWWINVRIIPSLPRGWGFGVWAKDDLFKVVEGTCVIMPNIAAISKGVVLTL